MVEMMITIGIIALLFPLFAFILDMYHDSYYLDDRMKMDATSKQALWYMEGEVRTANNFLTAIPSPFTDAYGPHDAGSSGSEAWSYKGDSSSSRVLIVRNFATTTNALGNGRTAVFENTASFNCTTQMHYQPQLPYITIFYVKNSVLYRRVLTDTTTALCAGNTQQQKQTCPPYITTSRDATCQANDEVLASQVSSFTVAYYQSSSAGTSVALDPSYTSTDPTILSTADYAIVTLTSTARNGAVTSTMTQRMTKVNQVSS